jgi:hypothetical protein
MAATEGEMRHCGEMAREKEKSQHFETEVLFQDFGCLPHNLFPLALLRQSPWSRPLLFKQLWPEHFTKTSTMNVTMQGKPGWHSVSN